MKRIISITLCCFLILSFTSCDDFMPHDRIGEETLNSVLYCLENDDFDSFIQLFYPSFAESDEESIENTFNDMRDYYKGNAISYDWQPFEQGGKFKDTVEITQLEFSPHEPAYVPPLVGKTANISQRYFVLTSEEEYIVRFAWIQNNNDYGLVSIHIREADVGYGISK